MGVLELVQDFKYKLQEYFPNAEKIDLRVEDTHLLLSFMNISLSVQKNMPQALEILFEKATAAMKTAHACIKCTFQEQRIKKYEDLKKVAIREQENTQQAALVASRTEFFHSNVPTDSITSKVDKQETVRIQNIDPQNEVEALLKILGDDEYSSFDETNDPLNLSKIDLSNDASLLTNSDSHRTAKADIDESFSKILPEDLIVEQSSTPVSSPENQFKPIDMHPTLKKLCTGAIQHIYTGLVSIRDTDSVICKAKKRGLFISKNTNRVVFDDVCVQKRNSLGDKVDFNVFDSSLTLNTGTSFLDDTLVSANSSRKPVAFGDIAQVMQNVVIRIPEQTENQSVNNVSNKLNKLATDNKTSESGADSSLNEIEPQLDSLLQGYSLDTFKLSMPDRIHGLANGIDILAGKAMNRSDHLFQNPILDRYQNEIIDKAQSNLVDKNKCDLPERTRDAVDRTRYDLPEVNNIVQQKTIIPDCRESNINQEILKDEKRNARNDSLILNTSLVDAMHPEQTQKESTPITKKPKTQSDYPNSNRFKEIIFECKNLPQCCVEIVRKFCAHYGIFLPEFEIVRENDVFRCTAMFQDINFVSSYEYCKLDAKNDACKKILEYISRNWQAIFTRVDR